MCWFRVGSTLDHAQLRRPAAAVKMVVMMMVPRVDGPKHCPKRLNDRVAVCQRSAANYWRGWASRAIMTSVDLTIAIASSPRFSFSSSTASRVMTAVNV